MLTPIAINRHVVHALPHYSQGRKNPDWFHSVLQEVHEIGKRSKGMRVFFT